MYLSTSNKLGEDPEKHSIPLVEESRSSQRNTMSRVSRFLLAFLVLSFFTFTFISASSDPGNSRSPITTDQQRDFQRLLNSVEPSSLHDILHQHLKDKFKHGVYSEDKAALEAVHKENAAAATSLIELAKRQSGPNTAANGTLSSPPTSSTTISTSATTPPPSSTTSTTTTSSRPPSTTSSTPPVTSSTSSLTFSSGLLSSTSSTLALSTAASSSSPVSVATSTTSSSSTSIPTFSSTISHSTSSTSTSSDSLHSSISDSTSIATSTTSSTPTPSSTPPTSTPENTAPPRFATSQVIITSTLPGGEVSTVTELTIVAATGDSTTPAPTKSSVSASLQSNSAGRSIQSQALGIIIVGIAGMAALGLI